MASGDCTITKIFGAHPKWGGLKKAFFTATLDNYATDGYTFDLSVFGLGTILKVNLPPTVAGCIPEYDAAAKKLLFYWGDFNAVSDGPLIQVANDDTTLGSATFQFSVEGKGV